uniref:uncharacterized protein LOC113474481 n=1 Tax=Ciona intestinalis TaxID=7719 RepID=UPI000EF54FA0|nr:uncharacterized protein LOC113474481 [Ciona intestinalis]|eukprot:XP_026691535.1 uncharacterized protein LOC113474481 [Ciona intestinalis]
MANSASEINQALAAFDLMNITFSCDFENCCSTFCDPEELKRHRLDHFTSDIKKETVQIYYAAIKMCRSVGIEIPEIYSTPSSKSFNTVKSLIIKFKSHYNIDQLYREYPHICMQAGESLGMPQNVAARLLIKVLDATVLQYNQAAKFQPADAQTITIDEREKEILEYIDGYLIKKAIQQYSLHQQAIILAFCDNYITIKSV